MSTASESLSTLISVIEISRKPYKIRVEVRRTGREGEYSVTFISYDREALNILASLLMKKHVVKLYRDRHGFTRLHVPSVSSDDAFKLISLARKVDTATLRKPLYIET